MPNMEAKSVVVSEIKEKLQGAKSLILIDYRGLTVEQDTVLRKQLRTEGVEYKIYKNSAIRFAVQGTEFEGISEFLAGPTAVAISYDDATAGSRIISEAAKTMEALEFKAGVIEGTVYDTESMRKIASIPSREVLLSKLLGSFKSPMASFARLIKAIEEDKQSA